jgi:uncharacterized membrane protein YhhN
MLIASVVCAAICGFWYQVWFCVRPASLLKTTVKTLSIACLALAAFFVTAPPLLILGLSACAVGDFWLSRDGDKAFLIGLISFAIGHVFYIPLFLWTGGGEIGLLLQMPWAIFAVGLIAIGALMATRLWPAAGNLRMPVMVYIVIIMCMGLSAITTTSAGLNIACFGAFLFVISDMILSVELFLLSENNILRRVAPRFVWAFYWMGQAAIFIGFALH